MVETFCKIPNAPRLALLADLHARPYQEIIRSLQKNKPEIIAVAGDITWGSYPEDGISPLISQPCILPFLEKCAETAPTFFSPGNHESFLDATDLDSIRKTGATVLDNEYTTANINGKTIIIGGLSSGYYTEYRKYRESLPESEVRYPRMAGPSNGHKPGLSWLPEFAAAPGYKILISHHPEYFDLIPDTIELCLSGHAHGGQFRFYDPFKREWRGLFAPGQGWFPRYTRGIYPHSSGTGTLIVSAGLANTAGVPRIFNPTEIVYISEET